MPKVWKYTVNQRAKDERKLRIALINPSMPVEEERAGNVETYPNIGIVQIATYIRDQLSKTLPGWEVNIDVYDQNISVRPILDVVKRADLVGVSMLSATADTGVQILKEAKRHGAITVAGNDHASIFADPLLRNNPEIDFVLKGDYVEKSFHDLILILLADESDTSDLFRIHSLSFGNRNRIGMVLGVSHNHSVSYPMDDVPPADLTMIPDDDRDSYVRDYRRVFGDFHEDPESITPTILNIAQGCDRFKRPCLFCGIADLRLRHKSPDKIFEEIKTNYALGYNYFYIIADDITSFSDSLLKELCARWDNELGDIAENIQLFVYAKADSLVSLNLDPIEEIWDYLIKMNVHRVNIGFESGDKIILKGSIGKSASVCQNGRVVQLLNERGIQLHTSMVVGALGETEESLKNSLAFVECILEDSEKEDGTNNIVEIDISVLMPVLGSRAWRMMTNPDYAINEIRKFHIRKPERMVQVDKSALVELQKKWICAERIDPDELARDWIEHFTLVPSKLIFEYIQRMREVTERYDVLSGGSF